mmetsp:Transcript_8570/g.13143  ORF Transcript_8570/g.13143 Transcript_8570/m.13143 type:complete len:212 (-) Transcript_8570:590-1225(-)
MVGGSPGAEGGGVDSTVVELHLVGVDGHRHGALVLQLLLHVVHRLGLDLCPRADMCREVAAAEHAVGAAGHVPVEGLLRVGQLLLGHHATCVDHVLVRTGQDAPLASRSVGVTGGNLLLRQLDGLAQTLAHGPGALNVLGGGDGPAVAAGPLLADRGDHALVRPVEPTAAALALVMAAQLPALCFNRFIRHISSFLSVFRAPVFAATVHSQ